MTMENILDSARRIVAKWTSNNTPLISNAVSGDIVLNVNNTKRFNVGDECCLQSQAKGAETYLTVDEILDTTHIQLSSPIKFNWTVAENALLTRTFYGQFIQAVYLGEPDPIHKFPAITIHAVSRDSEWMTLDSTRETYKLEINIYVESGSQEDTYRFLLRMVDTVEQGLKNNIMPLVGPYSVSSSLADIDRGDIYVRVADTSIFNTSAGLFPRAIIEDEYKAEEVLIEEIVDATTIKISIPICFDYLVADGAKIISPKSFIYNSWPDNIQFGTVFKGTFLKAAKISWFAVQEKLAIEVPVDVSLS